MTPVFGFINSTHCQGRKASVNNELILRKIFVQTSTHTTPCLKSDCCWQQASLRDGSRIILKYLLVVQKGQKQVVS